MNIIDVLKTHSKFVDNQVKLPINHKGLSSPALLYENNGKREHTFHFLAQSVLRHKFV